MNGKDLFDAINGVKDEYLDEVTAEIVRDSEQSEEGVSYAKDTRGPVGRALPWVAAVAVIAVLLTVAVAMHLRTRKPGNPEQTPAGETTPTAELTTTVKPTAIATAAVTETPIPDEEINSIVGRNRQLVCGWNYAADIRADGTVRITMVPGIESIADLDFYKPRVDNWKDIVSLRTGFEMLYAVDKNGHLWSEGNTRDYIRNLNEEIDKCPVTVSMATWIVALPVVEGFIDENNLIDGEYFLPKRSGRNIFLKEGGELVEFVFEDSDSHKYDIPVCRTLDEKVVSFEGHFYLKEDGTVRSLWDSKDIPAGMNAILKESNICELAENAIGVFGLRKNGTVACCTHPRYACKEIVESWCGVCGIAAEGATGASCVAVLAAVHTDGTVSAVGVRESGTIEIEEVKVWKNVVAVAVGYNGRFIAGKTADGEILFAVLDGYLWPGTFSLEDYSEYWSDETIREKVYEVIDNYTFVASPRSDFGYAPENQELYDRLAEIEGAAPYILRYVLERDNGNGNACDGECVAIAADLLGRSMGVDDAELPDGITYPYMPGTPKYYAARLVAAENK